MFSARRSKAERRLMQYVFQDPYGSLHPRQTVDDTLREPLAVHGIDGIDEKVTTALADVGLLPQHRYRYPHQLSAARRQRVAIARALILRPAICSSMSRPRRSMCRSRPRFLNLISRLKRSYGFTGILVSHDLAVVAHLCSRIAIMQLGRIVEVLDVEALRRGETREPYTLDLLAASRGYTRAPQKLVIAGLSRQTHCATSSDTGELGQWVAGTSPA